MQPKKQQRLAVLLIYSFNGNPQASSLDFVSACGSPLKENAPCGTKSTTQKHLAFQRLKKTNSWTSRKSFAHFRLLCHRLFAGAVLLRHGYVSSI
jgi:hypothetical protein